MERFTYSVTGLDDYKPGSVIIELEKEEAIAFAVELAREVLKSEPRLKLKGMCVSLIDTRRKELCGPTSPQIRHSG